jgi:bacillithiol system protein YtxJ
MEGSFVNITSVDELDKLFGASREKAVLIFKHSNACPISANAYEEMTRIPAQVNIVTVQVSRELSNEIEKRTGIDHHTPQAILIKDGRPVWSATHWNITADSVKQALDQSAGSSANG